VLKEEAHHLATGVRPARVSVRSSRAPAGPCVASSVKDPLLKNRSPAFISLNGASVTDPARCLAAADSGPKIRRSLRLGDDLIPVDGVDDHVAVAVEHDGWNSAFETAAVTRFRYGFGRTSMWRPRAPHFAHTTLLANDGTSVSSGYFDTSIRP
jgi:hypothetical protein